MKQFTGQIRHSWFAKPLALLLLVLLPVQVTIPQTTNAPDSSSAPASTAAPATPDQSVTPVTPDQGATPAAPDQATAPDTSTTPGHKSKKLVGAPDTQAPNANENGPIVREIDIQYVGPHTVAKSVILSNMRAGLRDPDGSRLP
ncbi:hypothetical protein OAG63_01625 [Methylacidiphilales bacterium]|nr:hypothetical protein [Candidatus Methylacidiphilales bacterium]